MNTAWHMVEDKQTGMWTLHSGPLAHLPSVEVGPMDRATATKLSQAILRIQEQTRHDVRRTIREVLGL